MSILLERGIELEDGSFRNFDVFDWYVLKNKYFDNFNRIVISGILDEFCKEPIVYEANIKCFNLRTFISKAYAYEFNSDPIHNDWPFEDNANGLTEQEKISLVNFMKENNIPLNFINYQIGVNKMKKQRNNSNDLFIIDISIDKNVKKLVKTRK